jgi:hypothetical protein|nr:MAG TPA: hypothetical protein [Caudoviricetes sp.]
MLSCRERFSRSSKGANTTNTNNAITYKDIQLHSFPGSNRLIATYKKQYTLTFPVNTSFFNGIVLDDIADTFGMALCLQQCNSIIKKHNTSRKLCIYHNSMMIAPLIELLINHNSYNSYHLFTSSIEYESVARILLRKYNNIVYNGNEPNLASMLRIIRNDQDDYYDVDSGAFDSLVVLDRDNSIQELVEVLHWRKQNTHILIPYNKAMIHIIQYLYRYYCDVTVESCMYGYCTLMVSRNPSTNRGVSTVSILDTLHNWYNKLYYWMRPMCRDSLQN